MHKDEFTIFIVAGIIGLVLTAGVIGFFMFGLAGATGHSGGGCSGVPLVNGAPAYSCGNLPPASSP